MSTTPWCQAENLLCIRLDAIGDLLMTGPAIRALKCGRPGRRVTVLTSPATLAPFLPGVDQVLTYEAPWMKAARSRTDAHDDRVLLRLLRRQRFDAAVIFKVYSQNPLPAAHLCYLADIPLRLAHCRENPYHLLTDACLVADGRVIAVAEEERFTRIKHAKRPIPFSAYELPYHAIDFCLRQAGIALVDLQHIAYAYDPQQLLRERDLHGITLSFEPSAEPAPGWDSPWDPLFFSYILNAPRHLLDGVPHH